MFRPSLKHRVKLLLGRKVHRTNVLVERHVDLKRCSFVGKITVGYRSYSNESLFRNVEVGRFCSIGRRCSIGAARHDIDGLTTHPFGAPIQFDSDPVTTIGNDVWIGDNVVIMAGLTIGDGSIVGAGAIVTKDVPPYAIVLGAPARLSRYRFDDATIALLRNSAWWQYGDAMIECHRRQPDSSLRDLVSRNQHLAVVAPHHAPMLLP